MAKVTLKEFADWLGLEPKDIQLARQIVDVSDPDGAYTHLQDVGEEGAAEAVEEIWFEQGSLKEAIKAYKEEMQDDEDTINESIKNNKIKTKKITLLELKRLVGKIIKEEMESEYDDSLTGDISDGWKGIDRDPETSLEEYGFLAKQLRNRDYSDEWFVIYKMDSKNYGTGYIREEELDKIVLGYEWADDEDIMSFLKYLGKDQNTWLDSLFVNKLSDLISYFGYENIIGVDYHPITKDVVKKLLSEK